jgi:ornithine cyclodeaminase/alanine dehydrogenase-like protein (mu-crystallin family)
VDRFRIRIIPTIAGIGVYGLERAKMLRGNPTARAVSVLVGPATGAPDYLTGDG